MRFQLVWVAARQNVAYVSPQRHLRFQLFIDALWHTHISTGDAMIARWHTATATAHCFIYAYYHVSTAPLYSVSLASYGSLFGSHFSELWLPL